MAPALPPSKLSPEAQERAVRLLGHLDQPVPVLELAERLWRAEVTSGAAPPVPRGQHRDVSKVLARWARVLKLEQLDEAARIADALCVRLVADEPTTAGIVDRPAGGGAQRQQWMRQASELEAAGNPDQAAEVLLEAMRSLPDDRELLALLARCLEASRRMPELLQVTERQLQLEKDAVVRAVLHTRAGALVEQLQGDLERAALHCREALSHLPGYDPAYQNLMVLTERRGDWEGLVSALRHRFQVDARPHERARVLTRMAEVLGERLARWDEARACLELAVRIHPRALEARVRLVELLWMRRELHLAEVFCSFPLRADDGVEPAPALLERILCVRARVATALGRPADALEDYALALSLSQSPEALLLELVQMVRESRVGERQAFSRALDRFGPDTPPHLLALMRWVLGLLHWFDGQPREAEELLRWSQKHLPPDDTLSRDLADFYASFRRFEDAAAHCFESARQLPAHEGLALAVYGARLLADHLDDVPRALAELEAAHARGWDTVDSRLTEAELALAVDRSDLALASLRICRTRARVAQQPRWERLWQRLRDARPARHSRPPSARLWRLFREGEPFAVRRLAREEARAGRAAELLEGCRRVVEPRRQVALAQASLSVRPVAGPLADALLREAMHDQQGPVEWELLQLVAEQSLEAALPWLDDYLVQHPFDARALELLARALDQGVCPVEHPLGPLVRRLWHGREAPLQAQPQVLAQGAKLRGPLLEFLRLLRARFPGTLESQELAWRAEAVPYPVAPEVQALVARAAEVMNVDPPTLMVHPRARRSVRVIGPPGVVVLPAEWSFRRFPPQAQLFVGLWGVTWLAQGVTAATYMPLHNLDLLSDVLNRQKQGAGGNTAVSAVAVALGLSMLDVFPMVEECAAGAQEPRVDFPSLYERVVEDVNSAVLAATQNLVGAVSVLLQTPPPATTSAAGPRRAWLGRLAKMPWARSMWEVVLADEPTVLG